jgi:putative Holliday junction resolvase
LAEPYLVIHVKTVNEAVKKVTKVVNVEKVEKVILGISEGEMARFTEEFGELLKASLPQPVLYQDETLSTVDAQTLSRQSGMKRKKRKKMEDAFAATLILQSYLETTGTKKIYD